MGYNHTYTTLPYVKIQKDQIISLPVFHVTIIWDALLALFGGQHEISGTCEQGC